MLLSLICASRSQGLNPVEEAHRAEKAWVQILQDRRGSGRVDAEEALRVIRSRLPFPRKSEVVGRVLEPIGQFLDRVMACVRELHIA